MKITMYELLGKVKDGKAPKKIKFDNIIWEYDDVYYMAEHNTWLDEYCDLSRVLNDEVEIIEEEKKIPEKLKLYAPYSECDDTRFEDVEDKINEIIYYLKSKGDE